MTCHLLSCITSCICVRVTLLYASQHHHEAIGILQLHEFTRPSLYIWSVVDWNTIMWPRTAYAKCTVFLHLCIFNRWRQLFLSVLTIYQSICSITKKSLHKYLREGIWIFALKIWKKKAKRRFFFIPPLNQKQVFLLHKTVICCSLIEKHNDRVVF